MKKTLILLSLILLPVSVFAQPTQKIPHEVMNFLHNDPGTHKISVGELLKHLASGEKATLIDVRTAQEYAIIHPSGAISIPFDQLVENLDIIPHDGLVVVYCHSGRRAEGATTVLHILGFDNVVNLNGGLIALVTGITSKSAPPLEKTHKQAAPVDQGPADDDEDAEQDMGC